jgi:xylulokinase
MNMSLMGVDVGTTGVKAVIFNESGKQLATAYEEYPLHFPFPGASELDSKGVIEAALRVIGKAAGEVKSIDPVKCIGIASQGEAFTPVAADRQVIGNAMTSSDCRAEPHVRPWSDQFGPEKLYQITGHTPYALYSLFKLLWIKNHQPEVWQKAWKYLFFEDLIAYALTGETKVDYSLAARSMLFDIRTKKWSDEILGALELDVSKLPEPVPSGCIIGTIKPGTARQLNLDSSVTVSVSGHDQPVGALGCGAATPGVASYSIGTVECICPAADRLILNKELMNANLASYPHVLSDTYTTVAFNPTGGSGLRWLRDNIAVEETNEARKAGEDPYDRIVAAVSDVPSELVLLPHFGPTGTPHFDSQAAGVLFGITLATKRGDVIRAFLEGITYEIKLNLSVLADSGFKLNELRVVGGGSKSATWMQIKADILGFPLTTMRVTEGTCMGAAILAGGGTGLLNPAKTSTDWATPIRTFSPRAKFKKAYEERFMIYQDIYNSLGAARRRLHILKRGD